MDFNFNKKLLFIIGIVVMLIITIGCSSSPVATPSSTSTPTSPSQQAISVVSVTGPLPPINPGGPNVEITLKNLGSSPVVSLTATLELTRTYTFNFDVSQAKPLLPDNAVSARLTLIGGGFSSDTAYPLKITGTLQNGGSFSYTEQVKITETASTTASTPSTTPSSSGNSATAVAENGLSLTLSLSSTSYKSGDQISIIIDEKNALTKENDMLVANKWPLQGLIVGPGSTLNYPFGIAILKGDYSIQSMASSKPLQLYDPNASYHLPMILANITAYNFQPSSDMADIISGGNSPFPLQMTSTITTSGSWAGSPQSIFSSFAPGIYTVVGGDEWGTSVIAHFTIQGDVPPAS